MSRRHGCAVLLLCLLAGAAKAAAISGQVEMRGPGEDGSRALPSLAVVWLDSIPAKTETELARGAKSGWFGKRKPPPTPRLSQVNSQFAPRVVHVPAGRSLVIANADRVWHGVFSVSPLGAFELGKRGPGAVDTVKFKQPGVVQVRCDVHPEETAYIVVTPNHASVQPGENGEWRLPKVPNGRYVLRAWAPGRPELRRDVELSKKSQVSLKLRW